MKLWPFTKQDAPRSEAKPSQPLTIEQGPPLPRGIGRTIFEMADAIANNPILFKDLDRHGVSELSVFYLGKTLFVSWYSNSNYRMMRWDGNKSFYTKDEALFVIKAAAKRAEGLFQKEREKVERARENAMPTVNGRNSRPGKSSVAYPQLIGPKPSHR